MSNECARWEQVDDGTIERQYTRCRKAASSHSTDHNDTLNGTTSIQRESYDTLQINLTDRADKKHDWYDTTRMINNPWYW